MWRYVRICVCLEFFLYDVWAVAPSGQTPRGSSQQRDILGPSRRRPWRHCRPRPSLISDLVLICHGKRTGKTQKISKLLNSNQGTHCDNNGNDWTGHDGNSHIWPSIHLAGTMIFSVFGDFIIITLGLIGPFGIPPCPFDCTKFVKWYRDMQAQRTTSGNAMSKRHQAWPSSPPYLPVLVLPLVLEHVGALVLNDKMTGFKQNRFSLPCLFNFSCKYMCSAIIMKWWQMNHGHQWPRCGHVGAACVQAPTRWHASMAVV